MTDSAGSAFPANRGSATAIMTRMEPNLARIPADGDADAEAITALAGGTVTAALVASLTDGDFRALGRYGARQPTLALREGSAARLRRALLATAISELGRPGDPRDLMVGLAVHYFVAQQIGQSPADLFDEIAARLPGGPAATLLREFGARQDITLKAFGWQMIQTETGPDFKPAPF